MNHLSPIHKPAPAKQLSGFTLLEVLVACGLLVLALSGIAAMLPASGYQLARAAVEERAAVVASNAFASILNADLVRSDIFPTSAAVSPSVPNETFRSVLFGCIIEDVNNNRTIDSALNEDTNGNGVLDPRSEDLNANNTLDAGEDINENGLLDLPPRAGSKNLLDSLLDRTRGLGSEDDLVNSDQSGNVPGNSFSRDGVLGIRQFKDSVRWGASLCLVDPGALQPAPGNPAILSVAVFSKPPQGRFLALHAPAGAAGSAVTFSMFSGDVASPPTQTTAARRLADEALRKQFLRPGAYVLIMPAPVPAATPTDSPRWMRVASSWTTTDNDPTQRKSFVSLNISPSTPYFSPLPPGSPLARTAPRPSTTPVCISVIGYDNLLRLEERTVVLK